MSGEPLEAVCGLRGVVERVMKGEVRLRTLDWGAFWGEFLGPGVEFLTLMASQIKTPGFGPKEPSAYVPAAAVILSGPSRGRQWKHQFLRSRLILGRVFPRQGGWDKSMRRQ